MIRIIILVSSVLLLFTAYFKFFKQEKEDTIIHEDQQSLKKNIADTSVYQYTPAILAPTKKYTSNITDNVEIKEGKIKWNQTLSDILSQHNVDHQSIHILAQKSQKVYDVRKIKVGSKYKLILNKSNNKIVEFILTPSEREEVIYSLTDTIYVKKIEKPVDIRTRTLSMEIRSSVYQTLLENNVSPILAGKLEDLYAWQVDFFRIAKGDIIKVIFEEEVIEGKPIGIGLIKGAYFKHWGKEFYAIPYNISEDKIKYFDEKGNSLRKAFLKAPLNYTRISSKYSLRRFHPVQKRYKAHLGTDYAAPRGTPIRSVGEGVVVEAGYGKYNGNYVKIKHNATYTTQYLHMSKIARGIKKGTRVGQGKTIGYVGSTGLARGAHLCFRFWRNGKQVNALRVNLPPSGKIEEKDRESYFKKAKKIRERLDGLQLLKDGELLFASFRDYPLPLTD